MSPKEGADKEFLSEAEELIETLGHELLRYEEALAGGGRVDPDILNGIFRAAHSLKGLAGMFGYADLGRMAHSMENLLDRMRLGKVPSKPGVLDVLFSGVEALKDLLGDEEQSVENANNLTILIEDVVNGNIPEKKEKKPDKPAEKKSDQPEIKEAAGCDTVLFEGVELPKAVVDVLTEYEEFRLLENIRNGIEIVKVHASFDITDFDLELPKLMEWLKQKGEVITTLPGGGGEDDDKIHFDLLVGIDESLDVIRAELDKDDYSLTVLRKQGEAGREDDRRDRKDEPADTAEESATDGEKDDELLEETDTDAEADFESARSVSRTVRVDISRLDHLMNIVGELVLEKSVIGTIRDELSQEPGMRNMANELYRAHRNLDRKLAELQEAVMDVRMVPIGHLFGRLGRIVRKVGREQDKGIELIRSGMDTELDKLIIEELADPLMHIIRNSIDHGIESPEIRRELGKREKGTIELHAYQQGNHVVIEVFDDGAGINPEKVRQKAVQKGLITEKSDLSLEETYHQLFEPGFSTKDAVSELSGRGVGLDVVKRNISNLSGLIEVESDPGEGTTFIITLPITLAIIQALIVECSERTYALPLNSVRECHILHADDIKTIEQREVMELREQTIPLLRLATLFGYDSDNGGAPGNGNGKSAKEFDASALEPVPEEFNFAIDDEEDEDKQFVVILGIADKRLGVLVDRMTGRQDVVIKSLGKTLGDIPGVAGATDLGNQQTVLVLDVGDLLGEIGHASERGSTTPGGGR